MTLRAALAAILCGAALAASGCSGGKSPEARAGSAAQVADCGDGRADVSRLEAMRQEDDELRKVLGGRKQPDPVASARKALDAGDYRLAAVTTASGISTELYGAQCRVLGGLTPWMVRALAWVPDEAAALGKGSADKVTDFGRRYNATVLADPRYPYADVCRALAQADTKPDFSEAAEKGIELPYGYAELGTARMSHGLGAAARRGSVYDIGILLGRDSKDINRPDMFGLTPLAWAVAYHRWPAAEALLDAHASPTGGACQTAIDRQSPLQIARIMRWSGMIRRLRPLVTEDEFASLRQKPRWDDASLIEFNHALTELKDRYEKDLRKMSFARHDMVFEVDAKGNTKGCSLQPGSSLPAFDKELCDLAIDIVRWTPARDAFGTTVPESAKLVVGYGGN